MGLLNIIAAVAGTPVEPTDPLGRFLQYATFDMGMLAALACTIAGLVILGGFSLMTGRGVSTHSPHHWFSKLLYAGFLATVIVLSVSSFASILLFDHMLGYMLLAHIGAAGGFVFLLLAIALFYLPRGKSQRGGTEHRWWVARWSAWIMVAAGIVTAATMFLSMLPILGSDGLHEAVAIHRWSGLIVVVSAIFHLFALCLTRTGLR